MTTQKMKPFEVEYESHPESDGAPGFLAAVLAHGKKRVRVHASDMATLQDLAFEFCEMNGIQCDGVLFCPKD